MRPGFFAVDAVRGVHVLVVDHDRLTRELLRAMLEYCGALVTPVASGGELLRVTRVIQPDVLLAALDLGGDDPYALIREVRTLKPEGGATIRAIAMGVRAEERDHALAQGFEAFVRKPVDPWQLCRTVADIFRS
jgi:CheY-like chemotaxis protein